MTIESPNELEAPSPPQRKISTNNGAKPFPIRGAHFLFFAYFIVAFAQGH